MDELKCQNCKYWKRGVYNKTFIGECSCPKFIYGYMIKKYEKDCLYYEDYEGYSAYIYTGEDFACKHFIKKGDEE